MRKQIRKFKSFAAARAYYAADIAEKRRLRNLMISRGGTFVVSWNSVEGGIKTMTITLDRDIIPASQQFVSTKPKNQSPKGAVSLRVWSTDRKGWRQFNVNKVLSFN